MQSLSIEIGNLEDKLLIKNILAKLYINTKDRLEKIKNLLNSIREPQTGINKNLNDNKYIKEEIPNISNLKINDNIKRNAMQYYESKNIIEPKEDTSSEKEIEFLFKKYKGKKDNKDTLNSKTEKHNNKNKIIEKKTKKNEHYYYSDNLNQEQCFTEIKRVENYYYFKCTTHKCKGFGKLSRNDKDAKFILTKEHSIPYTEHTYYKNTITIKNIKNNNISEKDWEDKNFCIKFFKNYFMNNKYCSISQCVEYTKGRLGDNINIEENLINEIQSAKASISIKIIYQNYYLNLF